MGLGQHGGKDGERKIWRRGNVETERVSEKKRKRKGNIQRTSDHNGLRSRLGVSIYVCVFVIPMHAFVYVNVSLCVCKCQICSGLLNPGELPRFRATVRACTCVFLCVRVRALVYVYLNAYENCRGAICVALRQKSGGKTAGSNLLHRSRRRFGYAQALACKCTLYMLVKTRLITSAGFSITLST